ncbi:hypothetical protein CDAR_211351 [Caerostris darwini]|uniref:Uncharacterized protein n=1 Tax=Caerostris darwini TaxID=1538125 RepID=A0AAV4VZE7_9ARAC|nr:hypothetical protein CDAR_211351 [Caerostris darwini]
MVLQTDVSIYRNDNRNGDGGVISDTMWVLIVTFGARQSVVALSAGVTRLGVGVYSLRFGQSFNKYADLAVLSDLVLTSVFLSWPAMSISTEVLSTTSQTQLPKFMHFKTNYSFKSVGHII